MPNSETTIKLPPEIGRAVLPIIEDNIPKHEYSVRRRVKTVDSISSGVSGALLEITLVVATASPACLAIAAIIKKWIETKSSKKIIMKTEKGEIQLENLSAKELKEVMDKCKEIKFLQDD